jgi:hypothetical protein
MHRIKHPPIRNKIEMADPARLNPPASHLPLLCAFFLRRV